MAIDSGARLTPREGRKFGLTVGVALGVLAAIGLWRGHIVAPAILGGLGALLAVAGLVIPGRLGPVHAGWMRMAHAISRVTTPIFLGIVYLVVLTPAGLLMRLLGRDPLRHAASKTGYWIVREPGDRGNLDRQF
ncbi:MAG: SxtJ family membrane protein [Candidatus Palauibacterales bacterium]|nr:SxtJ family membrane protein [Candidatus Palauibacterales bacterium]MDP2483681.1 SxtJ family membrane protein [Candidatus Palauibacterales bacterium]